MKTWIVTLAAGLLAALTACGGPPDRIEPKDTYPDAGSGNVEVRQMGDLAVSTHPDVGWAFRDGKETLRDLDTSTYVVYDAQGNRVSEVHNRVSGGTEELARARLPVGRYLVWVDDDEPTTFWVTVAPDQLTLVDTDALRGLPGERPVTPPDPVIPPVE